MKMIEDKMQKARGQMLQREEARRNALGDTTYRTTDEYLEYILTHSTKMEGRKTQ